MTEKKLTNWQEKHRRLLEPILHNPDVYRELTYLRRNAISPLKTNESQAQRDGNLIALMDKYNIRIECFYLLKNFCSGGDFDYSLIPSLPKFREKTMAKRDYTIYHLWLGLRKPKEITDYVNALGWQIDLNQVTKIIKRMRSVDVNRDESFWPFQKRSGQK